MKKVDLLRRFIGAGIAESEFASICNSNEIKVHIWEMPGVYFQYIDDLYPSSYGHIFEGLCIRERTAKHLLATRSYFIVISLPKDIVWDSSRTRLTAEQIDEAEGSTLEHILSDLNRGMMETITRMLSEGYVCHPINLESLTKAKRSIIAIGAKGREFTDACDLFVSIHLCSKLVGGGCLPSRVLQQVRQHQREKERKDDKDKSKSKKPNKKKKPRRDDDILSVLADKTRKENGFLNIDFPHRSQLWFHAADARTQLYI